MRKVTLHMVSSLDGYIAKRDNTINWLQAKDEYKDGIVLTNDDIKNYLKDIDCYVMGSHTYERALDYGWPYGNKPVIVLTSRDIHSNHKSVQFFNGILDQLFKNQLHLYNNIWVVGGAHLAKAMLRQNFITQIVISIMPILIGDGLPFFDTIQKEIDLHLLDTRAYKDGMVELTYQVI